jgi:hypothetical protein
MGVVQENEDGASGRRCRLKVERFRPLPARDGAAPAMHDPVWQWTTRPPCGLVMFLAPIFRSRRRSSVLAGHLARVAPGPDDLVFPGPSQDYGTVRRTWRATCKLAEIAGATPHDARHTFAVHAAQAGIPIVRLQKLLGHADTQP